MTDSHLLHGDVTYSIIGTTMEVHRILGPGLLESVYEEALAKELDLRQIDYKRQEDLTVRYKNTVVGSFRADFLRRARPARRPPRILRNGSFETPGSHRSRAARLAAGA